MPSAPNLFLPSPLCSQMILGMGANATAASNTMARAMSSPPVGAHILIGRGYSRDFSSKCLWAGEATVRVQVEGPGGGCSEPWSCNLQHCLELIGTVTPEDPHFPAHWVVSGGSHHCQRHRTLGSILKWCASFRPSAETLEESQKG